MDIHVKVFTFQNYESKKTKTKNLHIKDEYTGEKGEMQEQNRL